MELFGNSLITPEQLTKEEERMLKLKQLAKRYEMKHYQRTSSHSISDFAKHASNLAVNHASGRFLWGFILGDRSATMAGDTYWAEMDGIKWTDEFEPGFFSMLMQEFVDNPQLEAHLDYMYETVDRLIEIEPAYSAEFYVDDLINRISTVELAHDLARTRVVFSESIVDDEYEIILTFKEDKDGMPVAEVDGIIFVMDLSEEYPVMPEDIEFNIPYKCEVVDVDGNVAFVKVINKHSDIRMGIHVTETVFRREDVIPANIMDNVIPPQSIALGFNTDFRGMLVQNEFGEVFRPDAAEPYHVDTKLLKDALTAIRMASNKVRIFFPFPETTNVIRMEAVDGAFNARILMMALDLSAGTQRG